MAAAAAAPQQLPEASAGAAAAEVESARHQVLRALLGGLLDEEGPHLDHYQLTVPAVLAIAKHKAAAALEKAREEGAAAAAAAARKAAAAAAATAQEQRAVAGVAEGKKQVSSTDQQGQFAVYIMLNQATSMNCSQYPRARTLRSH
jgi:hypothetical protein